MFNTSKKHIEKLKENYKNSSETPMNTEAEETISYYTKVRRQIWVLSGVITTLVLSAVMDLWVAFLFVMQIPLTIAKYICLAFLFLIGLFLVIVTIGTSKKLFEKIKAMNAVKQMISKGVTIKQHIENLEKMGHIIVHFPDKKENKQ